MSPETRAAAVEMLPMPKVAGLDLDRINGVCCVWCGGPTSVALGPRIRAAAGGVQRWFPRACRACAGLEAARVYQVHLTTCARCTHQDYCPDSHALNELALEDR